MLAARRWRTSPTSLALSLKKIVFSRDKRRSAVAHRVYERSLVGRPVAPEAGMFGGGASQNSATRRPAAVKVTKGRAFGLSAGGIP